VGLTRRGDREAFSRLYERYKSSIYGYCIYLLGDKDRAEDALQDIFLKAHEGVEKLNDQSAFRPWLFTIARNTAFSAMKKSREHADVDEEDAIDDESPLEKLMADDRKDILGVLVASLKPTYREVILLREYEGLSYEEIAEIVGISVSNVKARLLKSRRALVSLFHKTYRRDDVC
jgi:RNA polymerase sigma-70 factor (ECF subfamily)